jgi:hypothetical protein
MDKREAAYILDPATTRKALMPYAYDGARRIAVVEEACAIAAKELRNAAEIEDSRRERS